MLISWSKNTNRKSWLTFSEVKPKKPGRFLNSLNERCSVLSFQANSLHVSQCKFFY